jgi:hypothetical protein
MEGKYSNYFQVGYNSIEFVLDFGQYYPDNEASRMHSRIIAAPVYARALLEALQSAVEGYEKKHGRIAHESAAQSEDGE